MKIEVWWQDEARVGQKTKLTRRWARRGSRPTAPKGQRTKSAYIFGAICPAEGKCAGLVTPYCDSHAMNEHLQAISAEVAPGAHAVVILDQVGWHVSARLNIPENITLIPLPPRSPELNPPLGECIHSPVGQRMENTWQFMRENWLSNRISKPMTTSLTIAATSGTGSQSNPGKSAQSE